MRWVSGYVSDEDLVTFLKKAKDNLSNDGVIVIQDNIEEKSDRKELGQRIRTRRHLN